MQFKSIVVTGRGGIEFVDITEHELRPPSAGEARIKILASPVCQDDVAVRIGNRPFLPKLPFVPGYSVLGVVDAIADGVTGVTAGDRVAALTQYGSHAEYTYLPAEQLVRVPPSLDPAEAVTLILNYLVAYQVLHRVAHVKAGDRALVVGASGGVGTAFLQLGKLAGLRLYGLASAAKHAALAEYGAALIDYHTQDFVGVIRGEAPEGIEFVFNGMAETYVPRGLAVLRRGGTLVHYGGPESFGGFLLLVAEILLFAALPNGKTVKGYGTHRVGIDLLKEDWAILFHLLAERKIAPIIAARFPILEAAEAYRLLESRSVVGNVVLLDPELLQDI